MKRNIFILILLTVFGFGSINAQEILMHAGTVNIDCDTTYTFKDAGGDGDYGFTYNQQMTVCTTEPGMQVSVHFTFFQTELNSDVLKIYEGTGTGGALLAAYSGNQLQGQVISSGTSNCLTFVFNSDYNNHYQGWEATINCAFACQDFSVVGALDGAPLAPSEPGNPNIVDVCMGQQLNFVAIGDYPNSGVSYDQNDANTDFVWYFGDGTMHMGQNATKTYDDNSIYNVTLVVTDVNGCQVIHHYAINALCGGDCPVCTDYFPDDGEVNTCVGTFFDSGMFGNYLNNENKTVTFCPDQPGHAISMVFEEFETESNDKLWIHDGATENHPLITGLGTSGNDYYTMNQLQGVTVTSSMGSGCLTYHWESSPTINRPGWKAEISCEETGCQDINVSLNYNFNPLTGDVINTCVASPVFLGVDIEFPNNNTNYEQTLESCTIEWDFGNGETGEGQNAQTYYVMEGTKIVTLKITDINGCVFFYTYTLEANCGDDCPDCSEGGSTCAEAAPFCTGEEYHFPCGTELQSAEEGPYYGCLISQPYPVWYYLKIEEGGDIVMSLTANYDIDYAIWGPFDEETCDYNQLTQANMVDCSFSSTSQETPEIGPGSSGTTTDGSQPTTAIEGKYYMFMITNYSQQDQDFNLSQTGGDGATDCSILLPNCSITEFVGTPDLCASEDSTYSISGTIYVKDPPEVGSFNICDDVSGICQTFQAPFDTVINYQLDNILADGLNHTLNAMFDSLPICIGTMNYVATAPRIQSTFEATATSCFNGCDGVIQQTFITGGLAPLTYSWSETNQTTDTVTGLCAGTHTVTISDANNCTFEETLIVEQPTALEFTNFGAVDNLCFAGTGGQAFVDVTGGTPNYTYTWSPPQFNTNESSIENLPDGTYTVTVTDANGCTNTKTLVVNGPSFPLAIQQIVPTNSSCFESNDGQLDIQVVGGTTPYMYEWELAGGESTTVQDPTGLQAGTHYVTVTDVNNCQVTGSQITEQPTELTVTYNTVETTCYGYNDGKVWLQTSEATPPYQYEWSNGWTDSSIVQSPAASYTVTVTDSKGCQKIISNIEVTQPEPVVMSIQPISPICVGDTATLTMSVTSSPFSPYTYYWNGVPSQETIHVNPLVTTDYVAKVIDAHGCESAEVIKQVQVYEPIKASVELSRTTVCKGAPVSVKVNVEGGSPNTLFYLSDGTAVSDSFIVHPSETTQYMLIVDDDCNTPPDTVIFTINVEEPPLPSFHADLKKGCVPLTVNFIQDVSQHEEGTQYFWTFESVEGDDISTQASPTYIFDKDGKFDVSLQVTDPLGCKSSKIRLDYIETYPVPKASFTATPSSVTTADPIIYFENLTEGLENTEETQNSLWYFGDGDSTYAWSVSHRYPPVKQDYTVNLFVYSKYGCSDKYSLDVSVLNEVTFYVPNVFSPNNDQVNDVFKPSFNSITHEGYSMIIFDRWGMKVFETNDINEGWDGKFKDKYVQLGAYNYIIKYVDNDGVSHEKSGVLNIIR